MRIDYSNEVNQTFDDLGTVYINAQPFKGIGYQGLLTVNTKTYPTEPKRSIDGSIGNINDYKTFIVPRCKVNFKYMNLNDYMRLCDVIMPNEFTVDYYDKQINSRVAHKMYCENEEMTKIYNVGKTVLGVLDYEVSFIGTLNDEERLSVTFDGNGGVVHDVMPSLSVLYGQSLKLPDPLDFFYPPQGKTTADKWIINDTVNYYMANQPINVVRNLVLKAMWK